MDIKKGIDKLDSYNMQTQFKRNWLNIILVNILAICFIGLGFFVPTLSIALAIIIMTYLEIGVFGYVLESKRKLSRIDFENIFLPIKTVLKALCIKIITYAGIVVWGLLLIVPGIIYGLNNCFAKLVFYDNQNLSVSEIMDKSKQLVYGKRFSIFLMALVSIVIVACGSALGVGIWVLISLATPVPSWATALLIAFFSIIALIIFALPVFEIYLASIYDESIKNQIQPKKIEKKVKNIAK